MNNKSFAAALLMAGLAGLAAGDAADAARNKKAADFIQAGRWEFTVEDPQGRPLGTLLLQLSDDEIKGKVCGTKGWRAATVEENNLRYPFRMPLDPVYTKKSSWFSAQLTTSDCDQDHKLVGTLNGDRLEGTFRYYHNLGVEEIGTFTGIRISDEG